MIRGLEHLTQSFSLTPENCRFYLSEHQLLMARIQKEEVFDNRVFIVLSFPFETREKYLSVQDEHRDEIGMIEDLNLFDEDTVKLINEDLNKRYFAPKIQRILKLTERYGSSFWDCQTDYGVRSFTVKDTYKSLIRIGEDRLFVVDHDGCRYEIESLKALDKKSYSKLELYL